jgi:hypothetical protein
MFSFSLFEFLQGVAQFFLVLDSYRENSYQYPAISAPCIIAYQE